MSALHAELLALRPAGGFGAILADPPWQMQMRSAKGMGRSPDGLVEVKNENGHVSVGGYYRSGLSVNLAERHYATLPLADIQALPIEALAAPNCLLVLWAVDPLLPQAIETGRAWGFEYKTTAFVWAKERRVTSERHKLHDDENHKRFPIGTGYWTRANPEISLLFTRGAPHRLSASVRKLVIEPRREHSRKPDRIRHDIEQLVAGPYLELFARSTRPGWAAWGNQIDRFEPSHSISGEAA